MLLPFKELINKERISKRSVKDITYLLPESLVRMLQMQETSISNNRFVESNEMKLVEAASQEIKYENKVIRNC